MRVIRERFQKSWSIPWIQSFEFLSLFDRGYRELRRPVSELSSIKVLKGRWVVKKFGVIACPRYVEGGFGRWSRLHSDLIIAYDNQLVFRVGMGLL